MVSTKGFTLIELLVVIAIIGLLSSIVISSLNSARDKGADASVKSAMKQMHNQAQLYLDTPGVTSFGTSLSSCGSGVFADTRFSALRGSVAANAVSGATMTCATDSTGMKWAVSISALKNAASSWCVDNSQGWFKAGTAQTSGGNQGTCQ